MTGSFEMETPTGRREAHKQATRAALRDAAKRLFADPGYEATTVRDIARAAKVTERTFYRYYEGKEGLLAEDAMAWLDRLHEAIRGRPQSEPPFMAVRRAMVALVGETENEAPVPPWRLVETPRLVQVLQRSSPRPLRRLEQSVTDAVQPRLRAGRDFPADGPAADGNGEFEAHLLGRTAVAVLRSTFIRHRELQACGSPPPNIADVLDYAFSAVTQLTGPERRA